MKKLFTILLSSFIIFSIQSFAQQNNKIIYTNGQLTVKEYGSKVEKPLGTNVKLTYDTFFKNYIIKYTDSRGMQWELTFDSDAQDSNPFDNKNSSSLNPNVIKSGSKYYAESIFLDVLGIMTFYASKNSFGHTYYITNLKKEKK